MRMMCVVKRAGTGAQASCLGDAMVVVFTLKGGANDMLGLFKLLK